MENFNERQEGREAIDKDPKFFRSAAEASRGLESLTVTSLQQIKQNLEARRKE